MPDTEQLKAPTISLHERRITLEDGRYMVFFTFTDEAGRDLSEGLHPWTEEAQDMGEGSQENV
ncbi:MAG: hypothetical protein ACJ73D_13780 [Pyrinomonadaceae bacterium]